MAGDRDNTPPDARVAYRLGRFFILRITGFPVEIVESLASVELASACDGARAARGVVRAAAAALLSSLGAPEMRRFRSAVKKHRPYAGPVAPSLAREVDAYHAALEAADRAWAAVCEQHAVALERSRRSLHHMATDERFRQVLLLSSPGFEELSPTAGGPLPERTSRVKRREQAWALFAQRLTTKNETISFFGPCVWGRVDAGQPGALALELSAGAGAGLDARSVYFERWTCEHLARAIEADPEAAGLLDAVPAGDLTLVRVAEGVRVENTATGEVMLLTGPEAEAVMGAVGDDPESGVEEALIAKGVLRRRMPVPIGAEPFRALRQAVFSWPESAARARWTAWLSALEDARAAVERAVDLGARRAALAGLARALAEAGVDERRSSQALFASRLPVNEDCRRAVRRAVVGRDLADMLTADLAPWYEMWRDVAGLYATRVHGALGEVAASLGGGRVPLPRFLAAAAAARVPIGRASGMGLLPHLADEIQAAWHDHFGQRAAEREVALSEADLAFVRDRFGPRRMKGFDVPAPDVQIAARSADAVARGEYTAILGEIHPDFVAWQHGHLQWCPDVEALAREHRECHPPRAIVFGQALGTVPVHIATLVSLHTGGWTYVGELHAEGVRSLRAGEATVEVTADDALVRGPGDEVLGSLIHTWEMALNTHRLELRGLGAHSPRLRVGRVVVQRESWLLEPDDALRSAIAPGGAAAFDALRELRRSLGLPEQVFAVPHLPIRWSLHKDGKPTFVDFRSPILLELFARVIDDHRAIWISEALPSTDQCWLTSELGRHSFELRLSTLLSDTP